ncbi:hypothetical protein N7528_002524 [Penicillium herquei]|nr:hypothetical protein N7528_002524 [Penicillium herquei]
MIFTNVFITSIIAATAAALPHPNAVRRDATATTTSSSASSTSTSSGGSLEIVNNMDSTVYMWDTSSESSAMETIDSNGGTHTESSWEINSDGGGISIKLSTSENEDSVLQFEYTVEGDTLYWDLSSINLDSDSDFITAGFSVTTNDDSCTTASCSAGDSDCLESYQQPDDVDTNSCSTSAKYTLTLG